MKRNNKHKATLILVVFTLGFLISYPFSKNNFWMGLFSGACAASMIGGLADWFAVTAIFRKPLGIYWPRRVFRTEIIPKNRENIVKALVDIVENDLLSKENIKKKVLNINLYDMLLQYMEEKSSKGELHIIFNALLKELYQSLDTSVVKGFTEGSLKLGLEGFDIASFLAGFIDYLRESGYDDEIIDFSLDMFIGFIKHNKMHLFFTNFVENIIKEYENGSSSRAMTVKMLLNFVMKKSPADIAVMIEQQIVDALYEVKNKENTNRAKIKGLIDQFASGLRGDEKLRNSFEKFKMTNIDKVEILSKEVLKAYTSFKTNNDDIIGTEVSNKLEEFVNNSLNNLLKNDMSSEGYDLVLKEMLIGFVYKKHNTIGAVVRDRIGRFSTEELVELIEGVAGNDLQMIRINGSVVGGIVGIITYLLTYWIR